MGLSDWIDYLFVVAHAVGRGVQGVDVRHDGVLGARLLGGQRAGRAHRADETGEQGIGAGRRAAALRRRECVRPVQVV